MVVFVEAEKHHRDAKNRYMHIVRYGLRVFRHRQHRHDNEDPLLISRLTGRARLARFWPQSAHRKSCKRFIMKKISGFTTLKVSITLTLVFGAFVHALAQEYSYETTIKILPRPDYDVDQEIDKFIKSFNKSDPMTKEEEVINRRDLRPQFQRTKDGFSISGTTTISAGKWGRYIHTIIPDLGTGLAKNVAYLVKDNQTYVAPLADQASAHIFGYDNGNSLGGPVDVLLLSGKVIDEPFAMKKQGDGIEQRLYNLQPNGKSQTWIDLDVEPATGRTKRANVYMKVPSGRALTSRYVITAWRSDAAPKDITVERFSNSRLNQIETYTLSKIDDKSRDHSYNDVLNQGDKIVDARLGTDRDYQLSYELKGELPTIDDLKHMRELRGGPKSSHVQQRKQVNGTTIVLGILAIVFGVVLFFRRGRASK